MSEVVQFPTLAGEERAVWACGCGCLTHYVRKGGTLECANCGELADADFGDWVAELPDAPPTIKTAGPDNVKVTDLADSAVALRSVFRDVEHRRDEAAFVIIGWRDGSVRTWGDTLQGSEQSEWFDSRIANAKRNLCRP